MRKIKVKQGSSAWERLRERRIGSSEVFDIVRYYATDEELQNCGLNAEAIHEEKPFVTVWALYHKIIGDEVWSPASLDPALAEYGHAMEPYGLDILNEGRENKIEAGEVWVDTRLIASLDLTGVAEAIDERPFDIGEGSIKAGMSFICEQKTRLASEAKKPFPLKYLIQAQFQTASKSADYFILQTMVLENDTPFERGKIVAIAHSLAKLKEYLGSRVAIKHTTIANNPALAALIKLCLSRFFADVEARHEPRAFLEADGAKNIIQSIRINSFYNPKMELDLDLTAYRAAKQAAEDAEAARITELQKIIDVARAKNASKFRSPDGWTASFSAAGAFLTKEPKEA